MKKWLSGDSNIYEMRMIDHYLIVDIVNLKNRDKTLDYYYIDQVKIPINYIDSSHYDLVLEQLQTNDLKHVGYSYEPNVYKLKKPFKTMYHTQVKGTLTILVNRRIETLQS